MLPTTPLGATGLAVPRLVLGTSVLGNLYKELPYAHKRELIAALLRHAGTPVAIDTAGKYGAGLALEVLGRILRELEVAPADVLIINKLAWVRTPLRGPAPTFEPGAWVGLTHDAEQRIGPDGILACHAQGCELLGAPYRPRLVAVHDPDEYLAAAEDPAERAARRDDVVAALARLAELRDDGEVAGVGVGAKDWRVVRELDGLVQLDWVMLANSLTVCRHEPELLEFVAALRDRGVGILNAAVFHSGFVVGGDHFDYRSLSRDDAEGRRLLGWRERFFALCDEFTVPPAVAALRFGADVPGVAAVVAAADRPEQVAELVGAFAAEVPAGFFAAAKERGVIDEAYPHVG